MSYEDTCNVMQIDIFRGNWLYLIVSIRFIVFLIDFFSRFDRLRVSSLWNSRAWAGAGRRAGAGLAIGPASGSTTEQAFASLPPSVV